MPLSESMLNRIRHQHETLSELIKPLSETQLKQRINPDKWSVFEQIAHLVAYQPIFLQRIKKIEHEDNPVFERYTADNDPLFNEYTRRTLKELLDDLSAQRFIINNYIPRLPETVLRRTGTHPKFGPMTIVGWTEFFLLHEAHHLFSIFALKAEAIKMLQQ